MIIKKVELNHSTERPVIYFECKKNEYTKEALIEFTKNNQNLIVLIIEKKLFTKKIVGYCYRGEVKNV